MQTSNRRVSRSRQRGMTFWGILFNVVILGGALVLILRVAPSYMTYMTVKDIIERAASDFDPKTQGLQELRTHMRKLLTTSQVYAIKVDDIEVFRDKGKIVIDATYEHRFPLVWIIDGVMVFDDLIVEIPTNR